MASKLTLGQQSADILKGVMSTWPFFIGTFLFCVVWSFWNTVACYWFSMPPFDTPGLQRLNLILSCWAALQGSILLIAAKRQDQITSQILSQLEMNQTRMLHMAEAQILILEEHRRHLVAVNQVGDEISEDLEELLRQFAARIRTNGQ
jgi:uncharacterized membrane protein